VITKYGSGVVIRFLLIAVVIAICSFFFIENVILHYSLLLILFVVGIFVVNFFRDPNRITPQNGEVVVSPADGKVVLIKSIFEPEYLHRDSIQISIFMSPLNVHVNRFPISGVVDYFEHIPGKYMVAFNDKSSELNERTHIGMNDDHGHKVLFKQIAGTVARRIVADIKVGQKAVRGDRFGMIKFGSRVDVIMPNDTEINVELNEIVRAGETVLARYSQTAQGIS
jgi:phosphatidylserine decarboxylase